MAYLASVIETNGYFNYLHILLVAANLVFTNEFPPLTYKKNGEKEIIQIIKRGRKNAVSCRLIINYGRKRC